MKWVAWLVGLAFAGSSATRVFQIKTGNTDVKLGMLGIALSYAPSMIYYRHHQNKYNEFVNGVSTRYRERIRDDQLE